MKWWKHIWKPPGLLYKVSIVCLAAIILAGFFASFLANNKPLIAKEEGEWKSPVVKEMLVNWKLESWEKGEAIKDWKQAEYDFAIWPIIPYKPADQDTEHISEPPLSANHFLGTDYIGRDVLSSLIYAIRYDMSIGIFAVLIAGFLGIFFGGMAGFLGDAEIRITRVQLFLGVLFFYPAIFYGFIVWQPHFSQAMENGYLPVIGWALLGVFIFLVIIMAGVMLGRLIPGPRWLKKSIALPIDQGISRLIEVVVSVPVIYLLIMLVGATGGQSIFWVIVAIGLTRWTGIARYTRAEMLKIKELEYATAARSLGLSTWRQFWNHALRNALPPVVIALAFGVANAILLESFLAFIGLGLPPDIPTWGTMLNEARQDPSAWWLAVFPGMAIFVVVLIFNLIGEKWNEYLNN